MEIPKTYNPKDYEDKIYQNWDKKGLFNPDKLKGKPYSIMMPPPNVTGVLHLGHALENSVMDVMARYQRMLGKKVLLLPGTDHAAVATQAKVEKILIEKGHANPREEFGREKLLEKIRKYSEESKATIIKQIKKMGTSCDWSRLAYTFDEKRGTAVNEIFKKMYKDGLIYRGYRVINWSVKGQSTCSDDELVHLERPARLYTFKYAADFPITIASTRPETKLGDTAVAVHPDDARYKKYIGQTFEVDFCGNKLNLKIISDPEVDPEFGTGALGVTPAHSPIDFEMYQKQKAASQPINLIAVIGSDGKMTNEAGAEFSGLSVEKAREKVIEKLKKQKLFIKEEDITQSVGTSDRFGDVVEAVPMTQWFVDVNKKIPGKKLSLKQLMKQAVKSGHKGKAKNKINITPKNFEKIYFQWIDNLRDWCISRQVWWGHRIPVWYKKGTEVVMIRHGQSVNNEKKVLNSDVTRTEFGLTEKGKKQVKSAAAELKNEQFDLIIHSPFTRTKETAHILSKELKISKILEDDRLREYGMGEFEGKPDGSLSKLRKGNFNEWQKSNPFGVESFEQVNGRITEFLDEIKKKYPYKRLLIVTHGESFRYTRGYGKGLSNKDTFTLGYPNNAEYNWFKLKEDEIKVSEKEVKGSGWIQDEDTLDTWFSAGLWTFSTLGWPKKTKDLKKFHPTNWMQMGYEILFFWMARMILMTTYALDTIPFKDVYIHGMLRDDKGQKFSKSAGNGVDPIEIADKFGTDALRWSLLIGISPGNDSRFSDEKVEGARNLVNKLWNISRYILTSAEENKRDSEEGSRGEKKRKTKRANTATLADKWILSRFSKLKQEMGRLLDGYSFSQAGELLREFTWGEFADWYLEISKAEGNKDQLLNSILKDLLKLWHPYVPFVTEAIYQEIKKSKKQENNDWLMISEWPKVEKKYIDEKVEKEFENVREVITKIRNLRSEYKVDPGKKISVSIKGDALGDNEKAVMALARIEKINYVKSKPDKAAGAVVGNMEIYLPLADLLDFDKEKERLEKEKQSLEKYISGLEKKLGNQEFVKNAPEQVVAVEKKKLSEGKEKLNKINAQLGDLV
ncbi:class I tRNA ligase family protein [Candidatus Kuenenbacteria bacterium]|nr:class I tRNA ligase family protein [Candidatus Kuenenbacteria bacterium]